jgi:hypothetical protein
MQTHLKINIFLGLFLQEKNVCMCIIFVSHAILSNGSSLDFLKVPLRQH